MTLGCLNDQSKSVIYIETAKGVPAMRFYGVLYAGSDKDSERVRGFCQVLHEKGWLDFEVKDVEKDSDSRTEMTSKFGVSGPPVLRMPTVGIFLDELSLHSYFDYRIGFSGP